MEDEDFDDLEDLESLGKYMLCLTLLLVYTTQRHEVDCDVHIEKLFWTSTYLHTHRMHFDWLYF